MQSIGSSTTRIFNEVEVWLEIFNDLQRSSNSSVRCTQVSDAHCLRLTVLGAWWASPYDVEVPRLVLLVVPAENVLAMQRAPFGLNIHGDYLAPWELLTELLFNRTSSAEQYEDTSRMLWR